MIKLFLIINSAGKVRVRRFYEEVPCTMILTPSREANPN